MQASCHLIAKFENSMGRVTLNSDLSVQNRVVERGSISSDMKFLYLHTFALSEPEREE